MNDKSQKLSIAARFQKQMMPTSKACRLNSVFLLLVALAALALWIKGKEPFMLTLSLLMFLSASNNFWASARLEVFEKEYVKKELEPGNREARETPAENLTE